MCVSNWKKTNRLLPVVLFVCATHMTSPGEVGQNEILIGATDVEMHDVDMIRADCIVDVWHTQNVWFTGFVFRLCVCRAYCWLSAIEVVCWGAGLGALRRLPHSGVELS